MDTQVPAVRGASYLGWSAAPPIEYPFASGGIHELSAWAKDAADNVSTEIVSTQIEIIVQGSKQAPIANAGKDQTVFPGDTVILDGSGSSDMDGDSLTYTWTIVSQPSNSQASLSDPFAVSPSFVVDEGGT